MSYQLLRRYLSLTMVLSIVVVSTAQAQTEVGLEKISASTSAGHVIWVFAGSSGNAEHTFTTASATGTTRATASTIPLELHAAVAVEDPDAAAVGYGENTAFAGWNLPRLTRGQCYRYLWVASAPSYPAVWAYCQMLHGATGEAHWKIPDDESGDMWIQSEINLVGIGAWNPPDSEIITAFGCRGAVRVADSNIS